MFARLHGKQETQSGIIPHSELEPRTIMDNAHTCQHVGAYSTIKHPCTCTEYEGTHDSRGFHNNGYKDLELRAMHAKWEALAMGYSVGTNHLPYPQPKPYRLTYDEAHEILRLILHSYPVRVSLVNWSKPDESGQSRGQTIRKGIAQNVLVELERVWRSHAMNDGYTLTIGEDY